MRSLSKAFHQLSLLRGQVGSIRALRELVAKITRKLLQPSSSLTYSQFGEDCVVRSYFNGDEIGFYLDIGCNDPITYSNTWLLYLKGWKGIAIDANPTLIERYKSTRTRDIAI